MAERESWLKLFWIPLLVGVLSSVPGIVVGFVQQRPSTTPESSGPELEPPNTRLDHSLSFSLPPAPYIAWSAVITICAFAGFVWAFAFGAIVSGLDDGPKDEGGTFVGCCATILLNMALPGIAIPVVVGQVGWGHALGSVVVGLIVFWLTLFVVAGVGAWLKKRSA